MQINIKYNLCQMINDVFFLFIIKYNFYLLLNTICLSVSFLCIL